MWRDDASIGARVIGAHVYQGLLAPLREVGFLSMTESLCAPSFGALVAC